MRRLTFSEGEYYHIYNRGVDKRKVFCSPAEYKRFLAYLYVFNDVKVARMTRDFQMPDALLCEAKPHTPLVAIGAYCLMPNHFHLYLTPLEEGGISRFMQRLQTAYTMFFNQKHERSGALFESTFKARHVASDEYAKYLFSYIHLNPAKLVDKDWKQFGVRDFRGMQKHLREYPYSSLHAYLDAQHTITDPSKFPEYFATARDVAAHVDDWLALKDRIDEV